MDRRDFLKTSGLMAALAPLTSKFQSPDSNQSNPKFPSNITQDEFYAIFDHDCKSFLQLDRDYISHDDSVRLYEIKLNEEKTGLDYINAELSDVDGVYTHDHDFMDPFEDIPKDDGRLLFDKESIRLFDTLENAIAAKKIMLRRIDLEEYGDPYTIIKLKPYKRMICMAYESIWDETNYC